MHAFATILTTAALLSHALVGCYGHHVLGCSQCESVAATALPAASCCDHDHDHGMPAGNQPPGGPCKCTLTCHGGCVSLLPQKTEIDAAPAATWFGLVADDSMADGQLFGPGACWERGQIPVAHQPPVRLHLLHQALLI